MPYWMNFTLPADKFLPTTTATRPPTCETHRLDWKHLGERLPAASSEQSDAPERRSPANSQWKVNRRCAVIGDVRPSPRPAMERSVSIRNADLADHPRLAPLFDELDRLHRDVAPWLLKQPERDPRPLAWLQAVLENPSA